MTRDDILGIALKALVHENKDVVPFKIEQGDDGTAVVHIREQEFMIMVVDVTE